MGGLSGVTDTENTALFYYVGNIVLDISGISTKVSYDNTWRSHFCSCFPVYSCSGGTPAFPMTSAILPDYSQNRSSSVLSSALQMAMHRFIDGL